MQFTSQARLGLRRFPGSPQLLLQPSPPPLTAFGGGQEAKQCNSLFAGDYQSLAVWRGDSKRAEHFQSIFHIPVPRSEEHTSELRSLMRISYAVFCLQKKITA